MARYIGIGLALLFFAHFVNAQEVCADPESIDKEFSWTIKIDIPRDLEVKANALKFTDPIEIFQNRQVIATADLDEHRRITFRLTDLQVSRAFVEINARCWTFGGCGMGYYHLKWKGVLPPFGKAKIVTNLVSDQI